MIAELRSVSFSRASRPIVRDVSLRIAEGERLALAGPNGAGKSTLLRLIAGLEAPTRGECQPVPKGCGYVPQSPGASLFPWFSVLRNVASTRTVSGAPDAEAIAAELLATLAPSISPLRSAGSLSGGEQQLVALTRALAAPGPAVLVDEPFSALAPASRARAIDAVKSALGRRALVLVTHDLEEAAALGARVVEVADGGLERGR